ncbi:MAG: amidohydrolase [Bryobacteraceae bacterium]
MRHFFFKALCMIAVSHTALAATPESADWIIHGRYVVTMDAQHRLIEDGAVAMKGARIVGVGTNADITKRFSAKQLIEKPDAVIAPGFIDTHTHAPMSLFRAIADDMKLQDWLTNVIFPAESKNVTPDFVRWGTRLACLEMVLAGITTYTDMYYFEDVEAETTKEAGVRGVLGETIIGFPSPDHKTWSEALTATEAYIQKYRTDPLITPAVAPHSIYTTPDEALIASNKLAMKYGVPLLIHLSETEVERDEAMTKRSMTPTQTVEKLGLLDGRTVAAHCVWEDDNDIQILKKHNTGVAHCPSSNTKLASGIARVTDMLKAGVNVGLGTDGFAGSNDSADLIGEMNLAAKLQKVATKDPQALPAEQALAMATIGGARVLGMDRDLGSLEEGKLADVITISLAHPNTVPLYNVYSTLVYAGKAADVEDVFINGRQIVANRNVLTLRKDEIYKKAAMYQVQVANSIGRK